MHVISPFRCVDRHLPKVQDVHKLSFLRKGYQIGDFLTTGGFSDVYKIKSPEHLIAKITPLGDSAKILIREASLCKYITKWQSERNLELVSFYHDSWIEKDQDLIYQIVISQKYDGDLFQLYHQGLSTDLFSLLKSQLETKLKLLHSLGIAHHDIKAENVLYRRNGDNVVFVYTDLGLAKQEDEGDFERYVVDDRVCLAKMLEKLCVGI